jgi:phenylacetic acid degradation protein paaN
MADLHALFRTHAPMIDAATRAVFSRAFHAQWPEAPSGKIYGETAQADGEAAFRAHVGSPFAETGQVADRWVGAEASPYGFELGITYPYAEPAAIVARAAAARTAWMRLHPDERAGVLAEALVRMSSRFFEIAFATMHTTGQGFMMAFQASGPHAFDRALEAVALGHVEQTRFASSARWEKPMGKMTVVLDKTWRCIGHGVSVAIGCSTFPVWNSFPGMFASLVTGNPVIVKPHPGAILPLAIAVASLRATCADLGVDPDIVQLAVDGDRLIADELVSAPAVRLVDYTGGSAYGAHLERMPGKIVFTEKAGINSIILDSAEVLDAALENIAFSLSLYSGQMCTKPQNIYVSRDGVMDGGVRVSYAEVVQRLAARIEALVTNEKMGPGTLGAIQNSATLARVTDVASSGAVALASQSVAHVGFEGARTASPVVVEVAADRADLFAREWFGPIACVIATADTRESIALAARTAHEHGAISFGAWCTDEALREEIATALMEAGANVSFNLTGPIWMNQSATFSDFHVTGGNPAGNASLTDAAFVARRFFIAGCRIPVS